MKVLDLFSGTHSVGKVCEALGHEVVSLDLAGADINVDILEWDYAKAFEPGHFDAIWASPPCNTFSCCRRGWIGRKLVCFGDEIVTAKMLDDDMEAKGLPLLRKAEEIIKYFKPALWIIENPMTGRMKDYLQHRPHHHVDYCRYSDWGYKKPTSIWTNKEGFKGKVCSQHNKLGEDCGNMVGVKHRVDFAWGTKNLKERYRVPDKLIRELLS